MLKLKKIILENFRCYKEKAELELGANGLTAIIGGNDAGKSSFFDALEIFFENGKIDQDDLNVTSNSDNSKKEVSISCVFNNLPDSIIIDADHRTTLKDEYLLNKDKMLEVKRIYNCAIKTPKITTFAICEHPTHKDVENLLSLNNSKLKAKAEKLDIDLKNVNKTINADIRKAIRKSIDDLKIETTDISLDKDAGKDIWNKLKEELPMFFLFKVDRQTTDQDSEAQDPMKAAVGEALSSQEDKLKELTKEVKKEVEKIANKTVEKIKEMDPSLASTLNPKFEEPKWSSVFKIRLTGDDDIPLNKRGSGVRRLILLNFFRARAEIEVLKRSKGVIYAIEEPETSQHPDNQKKIVNAFIELSENSNCQVLLTTHTPMLAKFLPGESLRFIEVKKQSRVLHNNPDNETMKMVVKALGVLPDNNVKLFIAVEGKNDINFLKNISTIFRKEDRNILDIISLEEKEEIVFFPIGGSNLALWAFRLKNLNKPEFHLYDRDVNEGEKFQKQNEVDKINKREKCKAKVTNKREIENYIPAQAIQKIIKEKYDGLEVCLEIKGSTDVPQLVAKEVYEKSKENNKVWNGLTSDEKKKKESKVKSWLNQDAVADIKLDDLNEDTKKEIKDWLDCIKELYGS